LMLGGGGRLIDREQRERCHHEEAANPSDSRECAMDHGPLIGTVAG